MLILPRFLMLLLLFISASSLASPVAVPAFTQRVTDNAAILNANAILELNQQLDNLQVRTGHQVAVLTVPTTGEDSIEEYAIRVFEKWKLGDKQRDDGVLLLIAARDRTLRIEVGYGLESMLTDAQAGSIINKKIVPQFAKGDFSAGVIAGVNAISSAIDHSIEITKSPDDSFKHNNLLSIAWIISLVLFPSAVFSKKKPLVKYLLSAFGSAAVSTAVMVFSNPIESDVVGKVIVYFSAFSLLYLIGYFFFHMVKSIFSGQITVEKSTTLKPPTRRRGSGSTRSSSSSSSGSRNSGGSRGGGGSSGGGGASGRW